MRRIKYFVTALIVLALPLVSAAQMADRVEAKEVTQKYDLGLTKPPSLPFFDLSRLHLSHSYSISYISGGGFSGTQAMYNGTLQYQLAQPLTLTLNLGILHDPGALFGDKNFSSNARFLPSGWLDWRPSKNFQMTIGFETVPASYYRGYYFYPGRYTDWYDWYR